MNASKVHEKDEDCNLDPETDECRECGVWHGDPCAACSGRGFHKLDCADYIRWLTGGDAPGAVIEKPKAVRP